jgi:hypothetical protein
MYGATAYIKEEILKGLQVYSFSCFRFLVKFCPFESLMCQEYRDFRSIEAPPRTLEIPTLRNAALASILHALMRGARPNAIELAW